MCGRGFGWGGGHGRLGCSIWRPYRKMSIPVVVLDNGGSSCKAGFAGHPNPTTVVPNCLGRPPSSKKWLFGDQLQQCEDIAAISLRRPFDRGYLINPDMQKDIWDRIFKLSLKIRPSDYGLLLVEPLFNLPSIQRATDELVFEDLGFQSLYVADSPSLVHFYEARRSPISLLARTQCSLVVDCGFSFTHAAPVFQNFTVNYAVKRLDLGGKALTNYLKELVSYRAINMMDETYIMDDVKEKLCFVSLDVARDLQVARKVGNENLIRSTYVLPDGIRHKRGFVKDPEEARRYLSLQEKGTQPTRLLEEEKQHEISPDAETMDDRSREAPAKNEELRLTNERFLVPEMLFHPADLGMNQAGLAECIVRAVNSCHPHLHPVLYSSIILTGGSTLFPGLKARLEQELRPLVCDEYKVKIMTQEDPMLGVWRGGSLLASRPDFESLCVTKVDYEELGSARCRRRFMH